MSLNSDWFQVGPTVWCVTVIKYNMKIISIHLIKARNKHFIPFYNFQIKLKRIQKNTNVHDKMYKETSRRSLSLSNYN